MAKIEMENYGIKVIIEDGREDLCLEEWVEMFKAGLKALTFTTDQIEKIKIEE